MLYLEVFEEGDTSARAVYSSTPLNLVGVVDSQLDIGNEYERAQHVIRL
jgi:hypothetical protein